MNANPNLEMEAIQHKINFVLYIKLKICFHDRNNDKLINEAD